MHCSPSTSPTWSRKQNLDHITLPQLRLVTAVVKASLSGASIKNGGSKGKPGPTGNKGRPGLTDNKGVHVLTRLTVNKIHTKSAVKSQKHVFNNKFVEALEDIEKALADAQQVVRDGSLTTRKG